MTGTLALRLMSHAAVIAGSIILWIYKDLEQADAPDRRRSWRLNGILACFCVICIWRGDSVPAYRPHSSVGTIVAWSMALLWIGHAIFCLGLLRLPTVQSQNPRLVPMSLGMATTGLIALLEELIFRGSFQNEAFRITHPLQADVYGIFAINLLFGLMHYNRGFTFAMSAAFVGTIFSIATIASGSLLPAIVMHVGWNILVGLARLRPHQVVDAAG
jgi:membrane protease YdiL (CAAX protease family)